MDFGKRLRTFVIAAYPEVRDFAAELDTHPSTVSMWFAARKIPGGDYLQKILNVGCSIDWLLAGVGDMLADNEAGNKLRKKLNITEDQKEKEQPPSLTYEQMVQVPFIADLRYLLKEDFRELLNEALAKIVGQKNK